VQTTVISTSANGQVFTTVFSTQSTLPPGATVTVTPSNDSVSSTSHTGAIVGGAVGGGIALILLLILTVVLCRRSRQRRRSLDAFDGNFDPDRVVTQKPPKGEPKGLRKQGPTLPNIAPTADDDDGMGGRLAGAGVGAGVIAPYPLYHPTTATTTTLPPSMSAQHTGVSTSQGHGSIPPSAYPGAYDTTGAPSVAGSGSTTPYGLASSSERLPNPYSVGPQSTSSGGAGASHGNRFSIANPDTDVGNFVGGFVPGRSSGAEKSAAGPASQSRDVLVHQDGGRVDNAEGPDEIPPTYDSLVPGASGSSAPQGNGKR